MNYMNMFIFIFVNILTFSIQYCYASNFTKHLINCSVYKSHCISYI